MAAPLRSIAWLLLSLVSAPLYADLTSANLALQQGRAEDASNLLHAWLAQHPSDPAAHLLLCRNFYAQHLIEPAVSECEAAAAAAPDNSQIQLWLGRAYGSKASAANPLVAFAIARKVRDAFERAVHLDPNNIPAASDLGEYYIQAPAIVGGGSGKARDLAARLSTLHQPAAESLNHRLLALLAEKENDLTTAESEFKRATATNIPGAWIDLAAFYAQHSRPDAAADAVHTALTLDRIHGEILVDAASVLTEASHEPDLARRLLRQYLASPAMSDAQPAFRVHMQLGRLLDRSGDTSAAHQEYSTLR